MEKTEIEAVLEVMFNAPDAVQLSNQQPLTPPAIGTLVYIVQGQGKSPAISINVGGDVKDTPLPGNPVFNSGELYLLPVIALPTWKVTVEGVTVLGCIFTKRITSVGGGLSITQSGTATTVKVSGMPYDTTGILSGESLSPGAVGVADQLSSDTTLIDEITIAVPSTNTGTITVGNATAQWVPLVPPSSGLAGISLTKVKPSNIYFKGTNTTDVIIYWYGGA